MTGPRSTPTMPTSTFDFCFSTTPPSNYAGGETGLRRSLTATTGSQACFRCTSRASMRTIPCSPSTKSVFTIHNLGYQGVFGSSILPDLSLGEVSVSAPSGSPAGRAGSTSWSTPFSTPTPSRPSPRPTPVRSKHPSTVPASMASCVAGRPNLVGIINGIDLNIWNPRTDRYLRAQYSERTLDDKEINKRYLLESNASRPGHGCSVAGNRDPPDRSERSRTVDAAAGPAPELRTGSTFRCPRLRRAQVRGSPAVAGVHLPEPCFVPPWLRRTARPSHRRGRRCLPDAVAL